MGLNSCENYESQKISLDLSKWLQTDNPAQPNLTSMGWVEKEPNPTQQPMHTLIQDLVFV